MDNLPTLKYLNNKLILTIPSNHNSTINMRELCQIHYKYFPPNVIKKVGDTYIICKSLSISNGKSSEESKKCEIKARLCFSYIIFGEVDSKESLRIDFQHCEFKDRVYFTNCEFNGNVFFNHAVFEKYADFHESIFNGVVSFYNAEFKYAPNFSTCVFQNLQATNFINVKIEGLDFGKIKEFIDEYENDDTYNKEIEFLQDSKEIEGITNIHKIRYASNARDSFRTIKNVLIANNNLLDASTWHKLELYAKEIELKLQKPCLLTAPKKWCDLWQLKLYRKTSAHHTDLLESIKSLLIVIGIFGVLSCVVIVGFSLYCDFWDWNPHILTKCYDKYIKCFLANHYCWALFINFVLFGVFIGIFIVTILYQNVRKLAFYLSCVITLALFIASPKYLIPPIEIFTDKRMLLDPLSVVGGVYSILFGFMLYSFIKTARKNSIIPN